MLPSARIATQMIVCACVCMRVCVRVYVRVLSFRQIVLFLFLQSISIFYLNVYFKGYFYLTILGQLPTFTKVQN